MDRPMSPRSILNIPQPSIEQIEIQDFHNAASHGFDYVKAKLQKSSLTARDALLEFYNYNENNNIQLTALFCLAICFLQNSQQSLNQIEPTVYRTTTENIISQILPSVPSRLSPLSLVLGPPGASLKVMMLRKTI